MSSPLLLEVLQSFQLGLRDALRPRLALSGIVIGLVSALLVLVVFVAAWTPLQAAMHAAVAWGLGWLGWSVAPALAWLQPSLVGLMGLVVYVLGVWLLMQVVLEIWLMPQIQKVCLARHPALQGREGQVGLRQGLVDGLRTFSTWLVGGLMCLLIPVVGSLLLLGLSSYLAVRSLVNDALDGKATEAELRSLIQTSRPQMLALGALVALWALLPVLGLLAPVVAGASTCHLMMRRLAHLRTPSAS